LDLSLKSMKSDISLDHVMRGLWAKSHQTGADGLPNNGAISEQDVLDVLQAVSGRNFAREIKSWVHGTKDLPLSELLATAGIETVLTKAPLAQQLGLKLESARGSIKIKSVLAGTLAAKAGFSAGDEWLAIEVAAKSGNQTWRIHSLDDLAVYAPASKPLVAWVARDKAIFKLPLQLPKHELVNGDVKLSITNESQLRNWLSH
jgi:predicted metalloprotease with PDZ domain